MAMTFSGRRTRLLTGCAMAAIAGSASAQSYPDRGFQGDHTVVAGNVDIQRYPGLDIITVNTPQAIINWNPETGQNGLPPGVIDFLPNGHIAGFLGSVAGENFTVLNRILPSDSTRAISLNGSITSAISDGEGNYNDGGSVWFYTPGGIIVGNTARFNVGNLVLTASDVDATDGLFDASGAIRFRGADGSTSLIDIQSGAQLDLTSPGSYLAIVAPRVVNAGNVTTAGSVAYIAAQSVDVRINNGLFDINFVSGTDASGQVLAHTGSTSSPDGDYTGKGIFLAAMPKNQAISMLLGGTIGYRAAATANVENGIVVLAAGSDIQSGELQSYYAAPALASILVGAGDITSSFSAIATDTITIKPAAEFSTNFSGSVSLYGRNLLVDADAASIGIGGSLTLDASGLTGGNAGLSATNGGTIDAGSYISLYAEGRSLNRPSTGEDTTGGTASIDIDNGRIATTEDLTISVTGNGGDGDAVGGTGRGGLATIDINNTGINDGLRANNIYAFAQATGGETGYGAGGSAIGGTIRVNADAAALQASTVLFSAVGNARNGFGTNNAGSATGGTIQATFKNLTLELGSLRLNAMGVAGIARGEDGGGGNGGSATGGNISMLLDNATVSSSNPFSADSGATGGDANDGDGGSATAGVVSLNLANNAIFNADVALYAKAVGGRSDFHYDADEDGIADAFGHGGTATGGSITLGVAESTLNAPGYVDLNGNAAGGIGAISGSATGGSILIDFPSGVIDPSQASFFSATADAIAGSTALGDFNPRVDTARSGDATGGRVTLSMGGETPALLQFSSVLLSAVGTSDPDRSLDVGPRGDIRGGTILASLSNATINASGGLKIDASARGVDATSNYGGAAAAGGNAFGGSATLNAYNSTISGNSIEVLAGASGGNGRDYQSSEYYGASLAALGGAATGGTARIDATGGSLGGNIHVDAAAVGGTGGSGNATAGAAGGAAVGGTAFASFGLTQMSGLISVSGEATGGAGGSNNACVYPCGEAPAFGAGDGGNAVAGNATLNLSAYNSTVGALTVSAAATGGAGGLVDRTNWKPFAADLTGGRGGNATGAVARASLSGVESSFSGLTVKSSAVGGVGGAGPTGGIGGTALSGALRLEIANSAPLLAMLTLNAGASGGNGGVSGFVAGAAGGSASAGAIDVAVNGADGALIFPANGTIFDAHARGGAGAGSEAGGGNGGAGGDATAGSLSFAVDRGRVEGGANASTLLFDLWATGGSGASGATGGPSAGAGGNGGLGGNATGGVLSFSASNAGTIALPPFTLHLRTRGGDGGSGGTGGGGQTGDNGADGAAYGQGGNTGGAGGTGGLGGNGARGGNALGGSFSATSLSGASIGFNLAADLSAEAGLSGDGGQGGIGGSGGTGGYGGPGQDDGEGNIIDPGTGGMGGTGGSGGNGGTGGDGADAIGGTFILDANGGRITADSLKALATAVATPGGSSGHAGAGGEGGEGGYGAQENLGNPGEPGFAGGYGNDGFSGAFGQAEGGFISVTARADQASGGTLATGFALLDATPSMFDGYGPLDGSQGQIHILANGAASTLTFNELRAFAGSSLRRTGYGLIDIGGTDAAISFNDTYMLSSGSIRIHLNGAASILAGGSFQARQLANGGDITISHNGLPDDVDTIHAGEITLQSLGSIDTSSSRLGALDAVDLQAAGNVVIGSAHVAGSTYADANGPHGAEIRVTAGGNLFFLEPPPHAGNLTVNGILDARGSVALQASNDIFVTAGASIGADNRVGLIADGDVTIAGDTRIVAARDPLSEQGYGGFDPFRQNGMLTIQAGAHQRQFGLAAGDIAAVVIGGMLNAGNGAISVDGAAIDATGSTASARYIRADIFNASQGGSSNDGGRLRPGCTEGLICLGGLNTSGTIAIGVRGAPLTASITGATLVTHLDVNAIGDIHFGNGTNPVTIRGTDYFHATSANGDIILDGPVTLQGDNDFALRAGRGLIGPQGSIIATNDLVLTAPGGLSLTDLIIGDQFLPTGPIANFNVTGGLELGSGDLILSNMNGLTLGDITVGNGAAVSLTSTSGPITVKSIGGAGNGTPSSIVLDSGGALTLTTGANTSGNFRAAAVGAANFGTSSAGGYIDITAGSIGFTALTATGNMGLTSNGLVNGGALASGGAASVSGGSGITLTTVSAPGAVTLTSLSGPVTVTDIGQAPLAKPTSITVDAGGAVTLTHAETAGNLRVNGASFATGLSSIITGGDIDITVAGLADLGNSSAGGHADVAAGSIGFTSLTSGAYTTLTSTSGITGTTLNSGAVTTLRGDTGVSLATLVSTGAVNLTAVNGATAVTMQLDAPGITASAQSIALASDKAIVAPALTATAGNITVTAASFSGTNASATGAVRITAPGGVSLSTLNAGAASTLNAANGAVLVSTNIGVPALNAVGRSVTLRATGSLTGLSGAATADIFDVQAGGSISGTAISANTDAIFVAPTGISLTGLTTGGMASLSASNGNVNVTGVASNGLTATARDIYLRGAGTLTATSLFSTVGGIDVQTGGNLVVDSANAADALTLGSTGGSLGFTTLIAGGNAALTAATTITGGTLSSNGATVGGLNGVTLTGLSTAGTAALLATNGLIDATNVSAGNVTATARGITLTSPTLLSASQLTATAGAIDVRGAQLALGTASATGTFDARASQGSITFTNAQAGGTATLTAAGTVSGTTLNSGGNTRVTGPGGVTIATSTSIGTGNYVATSGAVDIGTNVAGSVIDATGQSVRLRAAGDLTVGDARATAGNIDIQATGRLGIGTANASQQLLASNGSGDLVFTALTSGTSTTLGSAGMVRGPNLTAGSNATINGAGGIDIDTITLGAGGIASLNGNNGLVRVLNNLSAASVQAQGQFVQLKSTGTINATSLRSTSGQIDVQADAITANTVQGFTDVTLKTTNGPLNFTTLTAGTSATLTSGATITGSSLTSASTSIGASGAVDIATLATGMANIVSGGALTIGTDFRATGGPISGQSVTLRSLGALSVGDVTAATGAVDISTAGNLRTGIISASGGGIALTSTGGSLTFADARTNLTTGVNVDLSAATTITGGTIDTRGNATAIAPGGITLTGLSVTGTSQLTATNGVIDASNVTTSGVVNATANALRLQGSGALTSASLTATGSAVDLDFTGGITLGTVSAATTVNLTSGQQADFTTLTSGGAATINAASTNSGTLDSGGAVSVNGVSGVRLTGLTTPGTATLQAMNGTVFVRGIAAGDVIATGLATNLQSLGTLAASSVTATGGGAILRGARLALGSVTATGAIDATATGADISFTALTSGPGTTALTAATIISGGTLTTTGDAALTAPNGITLTGLNAGGASQLNAANGLVQVAGLVGSNVGITANAIRLSGNGAFGASALTANGGSIDLNFGGNVTLGSAAAATTLAVTSGGTLAFTTLSSDGDTTLTGTTVTGGALTTGGNAAVSGANGITLTGLTATGSAALNAVNGSVDVSGLRASDVFATGLNVALSAPGALTASRLTATNGNLTLTGTRLALGTASATGAIGGNASATDIGFASLASGGATTLTAATVIAGGTLIAGGNVTLTAPGGITLTGLNAGGASQLTAANGLVNVSGLVGSNVSVTAGAIRLAGTGAFGASTLTASSGLLALDFGGDITLGTASAATTLSLTSGGALSFTSLTSGGAATLTGTTVTGGTLNSGGNAAITGNNGVTLTGLTVTGTATLAAANGAIDAAGLGGGNYTVSARAIRLRGTGALAVTSLAATAGAIDVASAGNVTLGTGSATGGVILASTNGDLTVAGLTGGTTSLTAANGAIDAGNVAVSSLDASARSVRLRGTGTLTANSLTATAGTLDARFAAITAATASGSTGTILTADTGNLTVANLTGGPATLTAINGALTVANDTASDTIATARSIALTAPGALNASSLAATAGNLTLRGASLALGSGSTTGTLDARSSTGALGFTTLASGGNATLVSATTATGTTLTAGGAISITAPGGIDIANLRAVGAAALQSSGAIRITNDLAASSLTASGASLFLRSLGSLNAATLTATGGTIDIATAGALTFDTLGATGATTIAAGTTVTGTTLTSGGTTTVTAPAGITLGMLNSTGAATLTASNGPVRVNSEVAGNNLIVDAGSIFLRTPGALSLAQVRSSTGNIDILAAGNLSITSATAAGALTLASGGGNLTVGSVGGQLSPATASLSALGSVTLGDATARSAIDVTAGTVANLNGVMTAPTIAVRSADIAIGVAARIGTVTGTTQLTFTSTAGTATIGGASTGTGYRLSEAELQRAFANNITVATAPTAQTGQALDPNATPTMTLDTLTLSAAGQGQQATGNLGNAGTLRFQTAGTMRVTGAVKLTGAISGNRLELTGGPAIQLRPGGSASLVNGSDLAGTLVLTAADIIAGDATTLAGLSTAAGAKSQSDLLGANANPTDDTGYFAANGIVANIGHGLFVQNSGATQVANAQTFDQRRGLTFGTGGLTIAATGQTPVTVAVNGRQVSSSAGSGFVTGTALLPVVKLANGSSVVAGSTVNGCLIGGTGCGAAIVSPIEGFDPGVIARDIIEDGGALSDELEAASNAINRPNVLVDLPGFSALVGQPLIEDPVTGSGNDDLLADKDGKQCDPSVETCTGD